MMKTITYWVDSMGNIEAIDGPWDEFAQNNAAHKLTAADIIGKNLFSFMTPGAADIYTVLHHRVLDSKRPMVFSWLCDNRYIRYHLRTQISFERGRIRYDAQVIDQELLPFALDTGPGPVLLLCSFCKDFTLDGHSWTPFFDLARRKLPLLFSVRHDICADCRKKFLDADFVDDCGSAELEHV